MKNNIFFLIIIFNHLLFSESINTETISHQQIILKQEEIDEIFSSKELYSYFGPESCSLIYNLPIIEQHIKENNLSCENLKILCDYCMQDKIVAPAKIIEAALQEAIDCLLSKKISLPTETSASLINNLKEYYEQLKLGQFDVIPELNNGNATVRNYRFKEYYSLDVLRRLRVGCLIVGSDATICRNLTVKGNELIKGNLTVLGTISGTFPASICQPGPITIGTSNATSLTLATNGCTPRMIIDPNGGVTINTPAAGEVGLTINGGGETITAGDLNIVAGNVIMPAATPGASTTVSKGLIELGGANASATNITIFEAATRNLFAGNYGTVPAVSGTDNIALGTSANSTLTTANNTIAIGNTATATATDSIALGDGANTAVSRAIVIGSKDSTSTGVAPTATNTNAIAIGSASGTLAGASASGLASIAIGSSDGIFASATASGNRSIAVGVNATASSAGTVAIGSASGTAGGTAPLANNISAIAIGSSSLTRAGAIASGISAVAIGGADGTSNVVSNFPGAVASGDRSVAIGVNATANSSGSIAVGSASGVGSTAATATNTTAIAIGAASGAVAGASASGLAAVAIGGAGAVAGASASGARSVAIGNGATTAQADAIVLGNASATAVRVGIGTAAPAAKLHVVGVAATPVVTLAAGAVTLASAPVLTNLVTGALVDTLSINASNQVFRVTSSKRFKENFRPIDDIAHKTYELKPQMFDYKLENGGTKDYLGFIAEEVAEIFPSLVNCDDDGTPRSVKYECFHALSIKEIQKQQKQLEQQEIIITSQTEIINNLLSLIEKLQTKMDQLEAKSKNNLSQG